jgi:peptidoglycan hydrolase CwlO-like protein
MKVIKISDQGYAHVCQVASELETYLADALDQIIFGKVGEDACLADEEKAKERGSRSANGEQHSPAELAEAQSKIQNLEQKVTAVQNRLKELTSTVGKVPEHAHSGYLSVDDWNQGVKAFNDRSDFRSCSNPSPYRATSDISM